MYLTGSLFQVSDDINEMVEQIQAIQLDISELAGRPISLVGGSKRWKYGCRSFWKTARSKTAKTKGSTLCEVEAKMKTVIDISILWYLCS